MIIIREFSLILVVLNKSNK